MQKRWEVIESPAIEVSSEILKMDNGAELHPMALRLCANRGLRTSEEIHDFFHPSWEMGIHDPFLFSHMQEAVDRIYRALENGEHVTVHGDYDADGVSGSAVLIVTLREILDRIVGRGARIDSYIPHRDKEGYGLHPETVEILNERGTSLIITVDCGVACVAEIAQAKSVGIDTIVVDHHQFGDELPDGILIHPKLPGETYPFPYLAAVGVAWKLACALLVEARRRELGIPEGWEKWLLDFVSIATVTDMVPLVGENRVLETFGLKVMNKTRRPGLRCLIEISGCTPGSLTSESIAFSIGPRINAAGRMDHASVALDLLLAQTEEEAGALARQLEGLNRDRQRTTSGMMEVADQQVALMEDARIIVVWSETWSPSLVGLVAGRYLERTGKPSVAIGKHGDRWVGSGRSISSYDITAAVKRAGEGFLTHAGGHVQACGFSFSEDAQLEMLVQRLREDAIQQLQLEECAPILLIEAEVSLEDLTWELVEILERCEPYGEGNKRPLFLSRNLEVLSSDLVGSAQNHLRCVVRSPTGKTIKCIGFKLGERIEECRIGNRIDLVYDVGVNEWNGRKELQCKIVDLRAATT